MMTLLLWKNVNKELPDVNTKCICLTNNGNYLLSEMYYPTDKDGNIISDVKKWKGSSKTTDSIVKWSYLKMVKPE